MPAKSKSYDFVHVTVGNAHVWAQHVEAVFKRSNNVLHLQTTGNVRYLVKCRSLNERNSIVDILTKGISYEND